MRKARKYISIVLIFAIMLAMVPMEGQKDRSSVKAAVSGITNGGTYKIVSAYNGKAITQTDLSSFFADCVVWNTKVMSDVARWKVNESGDYYTLTNAYSGKSMKLDGGSKNGNNIDLNGNDNSSSYKWKLVPITSGTYEGCFYIVSAVKNESGEEEYAEIIGDEDKKDTDGATVRQWTKAKAVEYEPRQIWRFEKSDAENITFTETMNDQMVEAFKNKYFVKNSNTGCNSLGGGFWGIAEVMESMLDGYETTGKPVYKDMFVGTYNDFISRNGDYWTNNDFNDDIAWAVLASVRAYLMFGEQKYLDIAKKNYDFMYARATEGRTDGLLRWSHEDGRGTGTNSCINGPATVAACYLGIATGDESYYVKAKGIFEAWRNSAMYVREGDDVGHVWDTASNSWRSTYNQGTFIGAATMLYEKYGTEQYYTDACNAMKNSMNLCNKLNGKYILKEENTNSGDLSGMRGILMRYMRKFIVDFNQKEYLSFFQENAKVAWMNRNSQNLQQCSWQKKTSEDVTWDSFAAYNAISLMANIPTYADNLERDAYATIEAEDMDYTKGLISENSSGTSGGRSLGGVQNGHYTAYYNINFGSEGASKIKLKYSRSTEKEGASGTAEVRLGSATGEVIAEATLTNTGTWSDWKEITVDMKKKVTGVQNVYIVFKADTSYVCNFDYFKFEQEEKPTEAPTLPTGGSWNTVDNSNGVYEYANANKMEIVNVQQPEWAAEKGIYMSTGEGIGYITINGTKVGNDAAAINGAGAVVYLSALNNENSLVCYYRGDGTLLASVDIKKGSEPEETTTPEQPTTPDVQDPTEVTISNDIKVTGYQMTSSLHNIDGNMGFRVVYQMEPTIDGKNVAEIGLVYGIAYGDSPITESDVVYGSDNRYVESYAATESGKVSLEMEDSKTASYYARTMSCGMADGADNISATAYTTQYYVRVYAKLSDGSIVYSQVNQFKIYDVADYIYQNQMVSNRAMYDYLYTKILKYVTSDYKEGNFNWNDTIVK